jgi:hypothetical protein
MLLLLFLFLVDVTQSLTEVKNVVSKDFVSKNINKSMDNIY